MKPDGLSVLTKPSVFHVQGPSAHVSCNCLSTALAHFPPLCWAFPHISDQNSQRLYWDPGEPNSTHFFPVLPPPWGAPGASSIARAGNGAKASQKTKLSAGQGWNDSGEVERSPGSCWSAAPKGAGAQTHTNLPDGSRRDRPLVQWERGPGLMRTPRPSHPRVCRFGDLHFKHAPQGTDRNVHLERGALSRLPLTSMNSDDTKFANPWPVTAHPVSASPVCPNLACTSGEACAGYTGPCKWPRTSSLRFL